MSAPKGSVPWNAGKGQGWTDKRGYRWRYVERNGRRVSIREHRYIMELGLGRRLEPWELVHHKNGDKTDNAFSNLELKEWGAHTTAHHLGGRKNEDARRSMEAFALMREELKREREAKAEMLAALRTLENATTKFTVGCNCQTAGEDDALSAALEVARAAIAKAEGR